MPVTSNLKPLVDLPVWEWCRPAPATSTAKSAMTGSLTGRYLYYLVDTAFYRYDTWTDSWLQLANAPISSTTVVAMDTFTNVGYRCRALSDGGASDTVQMMGLTGKVLVGKKITIIGGVGIGQTRTITSVTNPKIAFATWAASGGTNAFYHSSSVLPLARGGLTSNSLANYQVEFVRGTGAGTSLYQLVNHMPGGFYFFTPKSSSFLNTQHFGAFTFTPSSAAATLSKAYFTSVIATVDAPWDTPIDESSIIAIESENIFLITAQAAAPFFRMHQYNPLVDNWGTCADAENYEIMAAAPGTDLSMTSVDGLVVLATGAVTAAESAGVTNSGASMVPGEYENMEIYIDSGTGIGQRRLIVGNSTTRFSVSPKWSVTPGVGATYEIKRQKRLFVVGGAVATVLAKPSIVGGLCTSNRLDYGVINSMAASTGEGGVVDSIAALTKSTTSVGTFSIAAAGTGYVVGSGLQLTGMTLGAAVVITATNSSGGVTAVTLTSPGTGATLNQVYATSPTPTTGVGTGCTIQVTGLSSDYVYMNTNTDSHFCAGQNVAITGTTQSEYLARNFEIAYTSGLGNARDYYLYAPEITGNGTSTIAASTTTVIADSTKSWAPGELVGKIASIRNSNTANYLRLITANTAQTFTVAAVTAAPTHNGLSAYEIYHPKPFGTLVSQNIIERGGNCGTATSGTDSSIVDTTKNWPVNYWIETAPAGGGNTARKVRIIAGTGAGAELTITSNTATTLNFAAQAFTVDATTVYQILDNFGTATGGSTTTLIDTTQNWPVTGLVNARVRLIAGAGAGNEYLITANTQTTLTFAAAVAPTTTTAYAVIEASPSGAGTDIFAVTGCTDPTRRNYLYIFKGGGTKDIFRLNTVTNEQEYVVASPSTETLTTGSMYAYDGEDRIYFTKEATGRVMYLDVVTHEIVHFGTIPHAMGAAIVGDRLAIKKSEDGLKYLYMLRHSGVEMWRTLLFT